VCLTVLRLTCACRCLAPWLSRPSWQSAARMITLSTRSRRRACGWGFSSRGLLWCVHRSALLFQGPGVSASVSGSRCLCARVHPLALHCYPAQTCLADLSLSCVRTHTLGADRNVCMGEGGQGKRAGPDTRRGADLVLQAQTRVADRVVLVQEAEGSAERAAAPDTAALRWSPCPSPSAARHPAAALMSPCMSHMVCQRGAGAASGRGGRVACAWAAGTCVTSALVSQPSRSQAACAS